MKTDGGCPANPGPGAWAFVIEGVNPAPIERAGYLPQATNNQAEYRAVTAAALYLLQHDYLADSINFWSDSQLVVRQLTGEYRVSAEMRPFHAEADAAIRALQAKTKVSLNWFRRENNTRADELCNIVLRKHGVELKSKK